MNRIPQRAAYSILERQASCAWIVGNHPEFPHQPTISDQFFDESQFESYRKLGYHIGMSVLREIVDRRRTALEQDGLDT